MKTPDEEAARRAYYDGLIKASENRGGPLPPEEDLTYEEWKAEMEHIDRTAFGHDGWTAQRPGEVGYTTDPREPTATCPGCGDRVAAAELEHTGCCSDCADAAYERYTQA